MPNPYLNEPNEDTLRTIDEKFAPVGDDRFIYSLQQKKWKPEDIHGFISKLQISYEYTELEYKRILKLKDTYNLDYPSDHKLYFDTAIKLMNKIHSTLASYNNIINGFNPKKKRERSTRMILKAMIGRHYSKVLIRRICLDGTLMMKGRYKIYIKT